jgi:hypothetical protein
MATLLVEELLENLDGPLFAEVRVHHPASRRASSHCCRSVSL